MDFLGGAANAQLWESTNREIAVMNKSAVGRSTEGFSLQREDR
jgi:hypothetical protein